MAWALQHARRAERYLNKSCSAVPLTLSICVNYCCVGPLQASVLLSLRRSGSLSLPSTRPALSSGWRTATWTWRTSSSSTSWSGHTACGAGAFAKTKLCTAGPDACITPLAKWVGGCADAAPVLVAHMRPSPGASVSSVLLAVVSAGSWVLRLPCLPRTLLPMAASMGRWGAAWGCCL
jgi:hypothetical protein